MESNILWKFCLSNETRSCLASWPLLASWPFWLCLPSLTRWSVWPIWSVFVQLTCLALFGKSANFGHFALFGQLTNMASLVGFGPLVYLALFGHLALVGLFGQLAGLASRPVWHGSFRNLAPICQSALLTLFSQLQQLALPILSLSA